MGFLDYGSWLPVMTYFIPAFATLVLLIVFGLCEFTNRAEHESEFGTRTRRRFADAKSPGNEDHGSDVLGGVRASADVGRVHLVLRRAIQQHAAPLVDSSRINSRLRNCVDARRAWIQRAQATEVAPRSGELEISLLVELGARNHLGGAADQAASSAGIIILKVLTSFQKNSCSTPALSPFENWLWSLSSQDRRRSDGQTNAELPF